MTNSFEDVINYKFKNKNNLKEALTHSSYFHENDNVYYFNERIEFLGDAVLGLVIGEFLYKKYREVSEGELSKMRANLVCEVNLAKLALNINLGQQLFLGKGEERTGGRNRDSILADAYEAIIGAIYIDGGISKAEEFIIKFVSNSIPDNIGKIDQNDHKTLLQEMIQKYDATPIVYNILDEDGPAHDKTFVSTVSHKGKVIGKGTGKTKKEAEQNAAFFAIENNH